MKDHQLSPAERAIVNSSRAHSRAAFVAGALALSSLRYGGGLRESERDALANRAARLYPDAEE